MPAELKYGVSNTSQMRLASPFRLNFIKIERWPGPDIGVFGGQRLTGLGGHAD
jgi:hypothetical protein